MNSNPYLYLATWVHTLTSIDAAGQASERTTTETTWASNTVVTVVTTIEGGVTVSTTIAAHLVSQTATGDSATSQTPAGITTQPDQPTVPPDSVPATSVQISTPTLTTTTTITVPATSPATSPAGTLPTTAASTTSSPAPAQTTSSTPSGISSGVVAGIGIACAVVGAALATCVLCYFVVRRRNARKRRSSGRDRLVTEKSGIALGPWSAWRKNGPFVGSTLAAVETSLPPPLQDSEVADGLLRLGKSITSHAGSYFNTGAVAKPSDVNQDYLAQLLGQNAPFRAAELTYLLANTTARTAAVRFLLAWCILQHVQGESDPCKSLLPPEIAESLESMNATELHDDSKSTWLSRPR